MSKKTTIPIILTSLSFLGLAAAILFAVFFRPSTQTPETALTEIRQASVLPFGKKLDFSNSDEKFRQSPAQIQRPVLNSKTEIGTEVENLFLAAPAGITGASN